MCQGLPWDRARHIPPSKADRRCCVTLQLIDANPLILNYTFGTGTPKRSLYKLLTSFAEPKSYFSAKTNPRRLVVGKISSRSASSTVTVFLLATKRLRVSGQIFMIDAN